MDILFLAAIAALAIAIVGMVVGCARLGVHS